MEIQFQTIIAVTIFLRLFGFTLSENPIITELPTITIVDKDEPTTWKQNWEYVNISKDEMALAAKHRNNPVLNLLCTAPYKIVWLGHTELDDKTHDVTTKGELSTWRNGTKIFGRTISIRFKLDKVGRKAELRCEHTVQDNFTGINVFVPGDKLLKNSGETFVYKERENWVRCPAQYPELKITVNLLFAKFEKNEGLEISHDYLQYDSSIGFQMKNNLEGTYVCIVKNNDFVRFVNVNPTLKIANYSPDRPWELDWENVTLPGKQWGVIAKNKNDPIIHLVCTGPYKLGWVGVDKLKSDKLDIAQGRQLPQKANLSVLHTSITTIKFDYDAKPRIGKISCEHYEQDNSASIYIFVPGEKILLYSGQTFGYQSINKWIGCPTSNPKLPVNLYSVGHKDNGILEEVQDYLYYDPVLGFQINYTLNGTYICKVGENDTVRFEWDEELIRLKLPHHFRNEKRFIKFVIQQYHMRSMCEEDDLALIIEGSVDNEDDYSGVNISTSDGSQTWVEVKNLFGDPIEIFVNADAVNLPLVDVFCVKEESLAFIAKYRLTKKCTLGLSKSNKSTEVEPLIDSYYTNNTDGTPFISLTWEIFPYDEEVFMLSGGESTMHTNVTSSFTCKTAKDQQNLTFWMEFASGRETLLYNGSTYSTFIKIEDRDFFKFKSWTITLFLPLDSVAIKCRIPTSTHPKLNVGAEKRFKTKHLLAPKTIAPGLPTEVRFHVSQSYKHIICQADGEPEPKYLWDKDGQSIKNFSDFKQRTGSKGDSILEFPTIVKSHAGLYTCDAVNSLGLSRAEFTVVVEDDPKEVRDRTIRLITIIGVVTVVLCAIIVCSFGIYRYYTAQAMLRGLSDQEIKEFFEGRPELAKKIENHQYSGDFDALPYNNEFEIDTNDAVLDYDSILGSGEFAIVVKGSIKSKGMEVAVKIAKATADVTLFKSLLSEVKILSYIGSHANITGLVGVNTTDIQNRNIYIYMDLCESGSLEKYLRANKDNFIDLIDETRQIRPRKSSCVGSEGCNISTFDLIRWSAEIASGMEYLSNKSIVHADLAARNVLLTRDKTVRVSDFGLSKKLYECNLYVKKTKCPLPWRWMALESLQTLTFSTASDVWSYGVTIWEIFNLGDVPFANEEWNNAFVEMLVSGIRMGNPKFGTTEIYSKIVGCWDTNPSKRPSFSALRNYFRDLYMSLDSSSVYENLRIVSMIS